MNENNITSNKSEDSNVSDMNSETRMKKILDDQSNQMLSLIDISNAHSDENQILRNKIKQLNDENQILKKSKKSEKSLKDYFNLQCLLFILLILLLVWIFYFSTKK